MSRKTTKPAAPDAAAAAPASRRRRLPHWKVALFSIVPVVVLALVLEVGLQLAGFGGMSPFFKTVLVERGGASRLVRVNQAALWPYFGRRHEAGGRIVIGSVVQECVMVPKPEKIVRVVLIGESTIQGFPHPPNLTAAEFLERFLRARLSGRPVEVVNCGVTAVASYPLRKIVRDAMMLEPDLVIIYAGHNEYFGAFGVASAQGAGSRPWQMALTLAVRSTAAFQAAYLAMDALRGTAAAGPSGVEAPAGGGGLMERMARMELIPADSPLRRRAMRSLEASIMEILETAKSGGAKVLLCSLAANERDQTPVRSAEPSGPRAQEWRRLHAAAMDAFSSGPKAAQARLREALALGPDHAATHFYLARTLELEGATTEALEHYRRARDLDAMPWRATTQFNDLLRACAVRAGVPFADVDAAFHAEAGGAPGWRLFADHLHPSLEGQALLARAWLEAIAREHLLPLEDAPREDWRKVATVLGDNKMTRYYTANLVHGLYQRPPLNADTEGARLTARRVREAFEACEPFEQRAIKRLEERLKAGLPSVNLSFLGGEEAAREGRHALAAEYFGSAYNAARRFTPERVIAAYHMLLSAAQIGKYHAGARATAQRAYSEGVYADQIGDVSDPPALHRAMAGLAMLLGQETAAQQWAAAIPPDSEDARRWHADRMTILAIRDTATTDTQTTAPAG
jgi:lysophospholipase L1-like esterase